MKQKLPQNKGMNESTKAKQIVPPGSTKQKAPSKMAKKTKKKCEY